MKKTLTIVLALCMVLTMSVPAFADETTAADGPVGDASATNGSSGSATVAGTTSTDLHVYNDDDGVASDTDVTGTDINVWVKVNESTGTAEIVYKLDIKWSSLVYEFHRSTQFWNPATHAYEGTAGGTWTAKDGNKFGQADTEIAVFNHSNYCMTATFNFTMVEGIFNTDPDDPDKVVGLFYRDSNYYKDAAKQLTNTDVLQYPRFKNDYSSTTENKLLLQRADRYNKSADGTDASSNVEAGVRYNNITFGFIGTPDKDINGYQRVGTITVTIAPDTVSQGKTFDYVTV